MEAEKIYQRRLMNKRPFLIGAFALAIVALRIVAYHALSVYVMKGILQKKCAAGCGYNLWVRYASRSEG